MRLSPRNWKTIIAATVWQYLCGDNWKILINLNICLLYSLHLFWFLTVSISPRSICIAISHRLSKSQLVHLCNRGHLNWDATNPPFSLDVVVLDANDVYPANVVLSGGEQLRSGSKAVSSRRQARKSSSFRYICGSDLVPCRGGGTFNLVPRPRYWFMFSLVTLTTDGTQIGDGRGGFSAVFSALPFLNVSIEMSKLLSSYYSLRIFHVYSLSLISSISNRQYVFL